MRKRFVLDVSNTLPPVIFLLALATAGLGWWLFDQTLAHVEAHKCFSFDAAARNPQGFCEGDQTLTALRVR